MNSEELTELRKITKILTLAHANALEDTIGRYASTDARKMIWVLIDGINMPEDIMNRIGRARIGLRTIYDFLEILGEAKLIENPKRKPPKKLIDFVPASWIQLFEGQGEAEGEGAA